MRTPTAFAQIN